MKFLIDSWLSGRRFNCHLKPVVWSAVIIFCVILVILPERTVRARERIIIEGEDRKAPAAAYEYESREDTTPFQQLRTTEDGPNPERAQRPGVYQPFAEHRSFNPSRPYTVTSSETVVDEYSGREWFFFSLGAGVLLLLVL